MENENKLREQLERDPGNLAARIELGSLLLRRGDFMAGWAYREHTSKKYLPAPNGQLPWLWRGESLAGKTILVFPDEGYGDMIQYFPLLARLSGLGASVIFQAPKALCRLFHRNAAAHVRILAWEEQSDLKEGFGADYYCAINSLPGLLSVQARSLPLALNYLAPDPDEVLVWQKKMQDGEAQTHLPKIGLTWQGNKKHVRDSIRSIHVDLIADLLRMNTDFHFYSLQMALPQAENELGPVYDCAGDIKDFADTAACLRCLDAVVTVDTSVAHLACAIGIPTFILVTAVADWRWGTESATSAWYPTAHLIRQKTPGDWHGALAEVMTALRHLNIASTTLR